MKHLFSFLFASLASMLAWGQTTTLFLELSAEGASSETVVDVYLTATPEFLEGPQTVSLLGDEDVTLAYSLPIETMQGVVTAYAVNCEGDSISAVTIMELQEEDSAGMAVLEAELDFPYCDDAEEEFEGWDEDLDLDDLEAFLDSLCGQNLNPDAWMYCGLLESLNACLEGDTTACLEVDAWLDDVEWEWEDDEEEEEEEEEEEGDCDASFVVVQAFDADSNAIANELFVYVLGYDEDNDFYWNFGDEGSSTDPLPTWDYQTDGPYVLCLTVTGEDSTCADTFCFSLSVDSLGWFDGVQGGFSITALPGEPGMVASVDSPASTLETPVVYPNPSFHGDLSIQWSSNQSGPVQVEVMDLTGKVVFRHQHVGSSGAQFLQLNPEVDAGLHLVRLTQGGIQRTVKWLVH